MSARRFSVPPAPVLRALGRIRNVLVGAQRRSVPPPVAVLEILHGALLAQALAVAAELGVADALAAGPLARDVLAERVGAQPEALARLLRPLIAEGIFARTGAVYRLTAMAQPLRSDAEVSMRAMAQGFAALPHRDVWSQLPEAVRTGSTQAEAVLGMSFFDYLEKHRHYGDLFDRAMTSVSEMSLEPTLAAYDFARYGTIADIGGGQGRLLTEILRRNPGVRGILFDLPEVVESVPALLTDLGLADRCSVAAGSFFESVPAGADAYILKQIVHDWAEPELSRILAAVRAAMSDEARLLVITMVLPDDDRRHFGQLLDLEMLVAVGGRERTLSEYRDLFAANGFELLRRIDTGIPDTILEARRAG